MRQRVSSGSPYEDQIGFSRAVRTGNLITVAGTAPIPTPEGPHAQAKRCLEIIQRAIEELGGSLQDVVRTRTYLVDAMHWQEVGRAHGEFFRDVKPASTMVVVAGLIDPTWLVEIEADAVVDSNAD